MDRALVVTEASENAKHLTREAGEWADGVGADLVMLHVTTEEAYENDRQNLEQIAGGPGTYSASKARTGARQFAANVAHEVLDDLDVEFDPVGAIGEKRDRILDIAERRDCDYVFLTGRKRSPAGKAIFGDTTQSIILNFDGTVVVKTD